MRSVSATFAAVAATTVRSVQCVDVRRPGGATSANSQARLENITSTATAPSVSHQRLTPASGRVLDEQKPSRSGTSSDNASTLSETEGVPPNRPTRSADSDPDCTNSRQDTTLVNGSPVTAVVPPDSRGTAGDLERRVDKCGGVHGAAAKSYSVSVTSSSHLTSSLRQPISVDDTPVTSPLSATPVQLSGPSVEHSSETLRTASTRASVIPHKTASSRGAFTSGPKDETDMPVKQVNNAGDCRLAALQGGSTSSTTHGAEVARVRSVPLEVVDVVVTKTGLALGFSIDGGTDPVFGDRPITVKKVYRGKRLPAGMIAMRFGRMT